MYMLNSWRASGLPDQVIKEERESLKAGHVWTSLLRLRDSVCAVSGSVYVILDSVDNMYDLIANLPMTESTQLYRRFTQGIARIIHRGTRRIKTFCFGVSPYLITEFEKYAISCYFLDSADVGEYFSYSDTTIQKVIDDWEMGISVDQCKAVASFQYNNNVFVNPYLSVSYMRSLKENGVYFEINLSPRSLWMKCIVNEDDLNILYNVFCREIKCKFSMRISMYTMCNLPEETKHRQLYYPLFIFGGFLSCKKVIEEENTYLLSSANESSKILIYRHLQALHHRKFGITVSECQTFLREYLTGNFRSYCRNLSIFLTVQSSRIIKEEKPYHLFMSGILSPLMLDGFNVTFDKEFGLIRPDTIIEKGDRIILEEYKHVIHPDYIPKKARLAVEGLEGDACCQRLEEFYRPLKNVSKSIIVKLCQINIIVFYLSQVILVHGKYLCETKQFSEYKIFASEGYFDNDDLKLILNAQ